MVDNELLKKLREEESVRDELVKKSRRQFIEEEMDNVMERVYECLKEDRWIDSHNVYQYEDQYKFDDREFFMLIDIIGVWAKENNKFISSEDGHTEFYTTMTYKYYMRYKDIAILVRTVFGEEDLDEMIFTDVAPQRFLFDYENVKELYS